MILDVIVVDVVDELIIISITMIVLVDDGDDGEGVEYSHAIITNYQSSSCSALSLSLDELQSHPNDQSRTCRRRRCPIPKPPPLGYLIHVIACPHWPMHRHAKSKPLSLLSSTRAHETSAEP